MPKFIDLRRFLWGGVETDMETRTRVDAKKKARLSMARSAIRYVAKKPDGWLLCDGGEPAAVKAYRKSYQTEIDNAMNNDERKL